MVVLALIAKPLSVLTSNLILIGNWNEGTNPSCPTCSYPMVKRLAKRGEYAGQRFWGAFYTLGAEGKYTLGKTLNKAWQYATASGGGTLVNSRPCTRR